MIRILLFNLLNEFSYGNVVFRSFLSVISAMRKLTEIEEVWIISDETQTNKEYIKNISIHNIFNYPDAVKLIEEVKPDVLLLNGDYEFLSRSLLKAAEAQKICTVIITSSMFNLWVLDKSDAKKVFQGRIHILERNGRKILRKYLFLIKTLYLSGYGLSYICKMFCKDVYFSLKAFEPRFRFGGANLNLVSSFDWIDPLTARGIKRENIVVTGDCGIDILYNKIQSFGEANRVAEKINALFITTAMVEHGYWKPSMRDELISKVINGIRLEYGDKVNLRIKIHPISEKIETYTKLIKEIDDSIQIIQQGDLLSLLNGSDIVITFGPSTALFEALLLKKPIFIMNLFHEDTSKNIYLQDGLAIECKTVQDLIHKMRQLESTYFVGEDKIRHFVEHTIYKFDGKCGDRAAEQILKKVALHSSRQ